MLLHAFQLATNNFMQRRYVNKRYDVKVSCVLRTREEQEALFWKSRKVVDGKIIKTGRHVTYCDGDQKKSPHQANLDLKSEAIDFFILDKRTGKAVWHRLFAYILFGRICMKYGLGWGGSWHAFKDWGHIQLSR